MNSISKSGFKLMGSMLLLIILCFFLCISVNVLCTAIFTKDIGYAAYGYIENEDDTEFLYEYYTADGEDAKKAEYEASGYTVVTKTLRSTLSGVGNAVYLTASQIICIILLVSTVGSPVYKLGFKDSNMVRRGHMREDLFKGFKIGLVANIPFFVMYAILVAMGLGVMPQFSVSFYKLLNSHLYSFIQIIAGASFSVGELSVIQYVLLLVIQLIMPIASAIIYIMGYKGVNLTEKLIYAKKEEN